ncbi:MAG: UDP-N-acetylmuramoyl-L-alanine--D-glutamate ligase [Desulfobulbaceae bacterium]|nr:UDP-N-acetylmuramoyl-L-alanine--D-glutamate ligase [Desulfobulbaceae bacterium]
MLVNDLKNKKIVIWGTGKEGQAVAGLIRSKLPDQQFTFIDEGGGADCVIIARNSQERIIRDPSLMAQVLSNADIVIKSPGVSLYHPLLEKEKARGIQVTSLLNLWIAENKDAFVIGITGTKGKSTTSTLLKHTLNGIGKKSVILGNIGVPVTECADKDVDFFVVEISSYMAASFSGNCNIAVLTSLYPEHVDWHKSLSVYYTDKTNLLINSNMKIVEAEAYNTLEENNIHLDGVIKFNQRDNLHFSNDLVYSGSHLIGPLENAYLMRRHNRSNVCAVLEVINALGLDVGRALQAMKQYQGLPHRQQELGKKNGVLFVDDSISTTPQSAIAAMDVYAGRPVTLIVGGFDRRIDYYPLINYIIEKQINAVVCMGNSGQRIFDALKEKRTDNICFSTSMKDAVEKAKNLTPSEGVVLLSPAAPSFGMYRDYVDRSESFLKECGFEFNQYEPRQAS